MIDQARRTSAFIAVVAATTLLPMAAAAAPADRAADRADARRERRDAVRGAAATGPVAPSLLFRSPLRALAFDGTEGETPQAPSLTFELSAPLSYNTNPERASSKKDGDGHVDPSFDASLEIPMKGMLLTLDATADMDLNFARPSNDSTTLGGSANLDFKTKRLRGALPYLNYEVNDIYAGQFEDHDVTTHTLAAGLNYEREFKPRPADKAVTFALNLEAGRRLASSADSEQDRGRISLGFSGAFTEKLGWSAKQTVVFKDYTGGANKGRDDITFTTTAALKTSFANGVALAMTAQFEHNDSDRTGKDYSFWDIGPALTKTF